MLAFDEMAGRLALLNGLPLDMAGRYMALIGDTPEMANDGRVVVRDDDDVEIARLNFEWTDDTRAARNPGAP